MMAKVVRSTILDATPEAVWAVLRDFNGHEKWHPEVMSSRIERGDAADRVSCVRRFQLDDGSELRERLLTLSDVELTFTYCLLDTPIPLFNYVSHVRLFEVTDGRRTFWEWEGRFDTTTGRREELERFVGVQLYDAGFAAIRRHMGLES